MFQYQGNNICNKLAITLIFMDYVYNLEYIVGGGEGKKKNNKTHKNSQIQNHRKKILNKAESIKYMLFMSTFNKCFLNVVFRVLLSLFLHKEQASVPLVNHKLTEIPGCATSAIPWL